MMGAFFLGSGVDHSRPSGSGMASLCKCLSSSCPLFMFFTVLFGRFSLRVAHFASLLVLFINRACSHSALSLPLSLCTSLSHFLTLCLCRCFFFLFAVDLLLACQNSAAKKNIYLFVFCRLVANDFSQMMRDSVGYAPLSLSLTHTRSLSLSVLYNHHSRIAQCSEPITESDFQFRTVNFSDIPQLLSQFLWLSPLIMTGKTLCELNEDSPCLELLYGGCFCCQCCCCCSVPQSSCGFHTIAHDSAN